MSYKKLLSAFLIVVFLSSSIYFMLPDKVRIDIENTRTKYSVWENESWVLAATEYVNLYDGTTKMRAKSRRLDYWNDSSFAYVNRVSTWKDNITTIQTYTFDKSAEDVELVPINNIVQCINCVGKILHYEIRDILYDGITKRIESPFSFGHNMKIEWQDGAYYSKVFQQKSSDKIIVKFRPSQSDQSFYLRLFDPVYYNGNIITTINTELGSQLNLTANLTGASTVCVDIDHPEYGNNYTCGSPNANFTFNVSYFRQDEFVNGTTTEIVLSDFSLFNGTTYDGGSYDTSAPKEWCGEYYVDNPISKFKITYNVYSWVQGVDYTSDVPVYPQITIRDSNRDLLETIIDTDFNENIFETDSVVSSELYSPGLYGFCIKIPFVQKAPAINDTVYDVVYSSSVYAMYGKVTMSYNYFANRSFSTIDTSGFGADNRMYHKYFYKDATSESTPSRVVPAGTNYFDNPNTSKTLDYVEVWAWTRNAGPGQVGMHIFSSGIYHIITEACLNGTQTTNCNGGGFSVTNAQGETYTVTGDFLSKPPLITTYAQNDSTVFVLGHKYNEINNLSFNLTAIDSATDVQIYIGDVAANFIGFIFNTTEGEVSETEETEFTLISPNSTTFSIPKGAVVTNTTLNFTGENITWEISDYAIPLTYSASHTAPVPSLPSGVQSWFGPLADAVDGNFLSGAGPWIDGPVFWDVKWVSTIYENYTKDTNAFYGEWTSGYSCSNSAQITFDSDCWSGSSWIEILSDAGTGCPSYPDTKTFDLPSSCVSQDILQVRNTLQYGDDSGLVHRAYYRDGQVDYFRYGYPEDLKIQIGIPDGTFDYSGSGELTGSDSATGFEDSVNDYLDTCTADSDGFCDVPIYFTSSDGGFLTIDNMTISYTYDVNPIVIDSSFIDDFLSTSTDGFIDIPIIISLATGSLEISDLKYDYAGGNDTIEVLVYDANATIDCYQETANQSHSSDTEGCHSLNYNGSYFAPNQPADNSWHIAGNLYDEDYDTYTYDWNQADANDAIFSINYTKPNGVTSAEWRTKLVSTDENLTIPSDCFSYNADWLFLNITSNGNSNLVKTYCLNATGYKELSSYSGTNVYEEAIIWGDVPGQSDKDNGDILNIVNWYSDWDYILPLTIDFLEFIPLSPSDKDVIPYGQTSLTQFFNITNYGYGGMQSNFSIFLNETHSCVNLTVSTTNNKSDGFLLNDTWTDLFVDFDYLNSSGIWMWADYGCSDSSWRWWFPDMYFRNCCESCVCTEELI